eukprot:SAG11_NODE_34_length_22265_cov_11.264730_6_plen_145_part_00
MPACRVGTAVGLGRRASPSRRAHHHCHCSCSRNTTSHLKVGAAMTIVLSQPHAEVLGRDLTELHISNRDTTCVQCLFHLDEPNLGRPLPRCVDKCPRRFRGERLPLVVVRPCAGENHKEHHSKWRAGLCVRACPRRLSDHERSD